MKSNPSRLHVPRTPEHQSRREAPKAETAVAGEESGEVLREHAKKATAAIMLNIRQRLEFGFSPSDYQLPTQTAGVIPLISAGELCPRYEQYLIVEMTIDREGRALHDTIRDSARTVAIGGYLNFLCFLTVDSVACVRFFR
jgi:hypothetical protein